jgi:hypothetical protein
MKKNRSIRVKASSRNASFCLEGASLSRQAVLEAVTRQHQSYLDAELLRLIELFRLEPEELAEAGMSYETLKLLEKKAIFS